VRAFSCTYDAWNRLVSVVDATTSETVAQYAHDARGYRVVSQAFASGVSTETRDFFYSDQWQVVEERVGQPTADRHFVWGSRYIDDLVLRDRDTTGDGTLDERLYGRLLVAVRRCDTVLRLLLGRERRFLPRPKPRAPVGPRALGQARPD
jgi:hypothetical protein